MNKPNKHQDGNWTECLRRPLELYMRVMHQSIPSANIPPPGKPPGNFFEVVKSPAPGQNFPSTARARGKKHLPLGSILEDLVSLSC